jgi:hypothetical protein
MRRLPLLVIATLALAACADCRVKPDVLKTCDNLETHQCAVRSRIDGAVLKWECDL